MADLINGVVGFANSRRQSKNLEEQAKLAKAEAQVEAQRQADEARKFGKTQRLSFLKSGVRVAGSPFLVLQETLRQGREQVAAVARQGDAKVSMLNQQAATVRNEGRAGLIAGVVSTGSKAASAGAGAGGEGAGAGPGGEG